MCAFNFWTSFYYTMCSLYRSVVNLHFRPADQIISNSFRLLAQDLFPEALSSFISFLTE